MDFSLLRRLFLLPPPTMSVLETHLPAFAWPLKVSGRSTSHDPPSYLYPQFCTVTIGATWVASLVTGNVSQVDRLWTFLPTIYLAYFALLPLWPTSSSAWNILPYVPEEIGSASKTFSPRALLMLGCVLFMVSRDDMLTKLQSGCDLDVQVELQYV